jgi:hypothetical protein
MTTDQAVTAFQALLLRELRIEPGTQAALAPETPEEAEARRLRCAEALLQSVCGGLARCRDPRCRRSRRCQYLGDAAPSPAAGHTAQRRTPGAIAMRRAIRAWMMAQGPGKVPGRGRP